ncbi:hypothetical protein Poli38472_000580 [Pythium oligandrum]|uniref:Uncharacterized protein n=1 Tax=Pythium oligandrum TaxID=41045 RepID=A0A8K1FJ98_PYTOL|nr:hypothetical protein Poli38472_000580 [Pythium oligandrum]|eukprot:TMW60538.1 hypothetical protein Poli38472_000580 [Pythium oligandrum]
MLAAATLEGHQMDAVFAIALLFAVVLLPPILRIRLMYTVCWLAFGIISHFLESPAALGIATSMGITVMIGWYTLRVIDRYAFTAVLNGWLGSWSKSRPLGLFARAGDLVIHCFLPLLFLYLYLPHVRIWMCIPALISSRLWSHFVVGGGLFPTADHVYRFVPPRSKHFWTTAYRMELVLNVLIPCACEVVHSTGIYDQLVNVL